MKKIILAALVVALFAACSTSPLSGPDIAPICKDNMVKGVPGCYNGGA